MMNFKQWLENTDNESLLNQNYVDNFEKMLKSKYGLEQLALIYYPQYDRIHLMNLIVPKQNRKQGIGTKVMQELVQFAHKHNCSVTLTPGVRDRHVGTTSQERLKRFYRGLGFKKNKDYRFSASMVNKPNITLPKFPKNY